MFRPFAAALLSPLTLVLPLAAQSADAPAAVPAGTPTLTVTKVGGVTTLAWSPLADAPLYDVVRGSLASLRATGGFSSGTGGCIQDDRRPLAATDATVPAAGDGWWYLVRGVNCDGDGTYNDGSQFGNRDPGVNATGRCMPVSCTPGTDTDADRLDNCSETGTGLYCSPTRTGTSPTLADTDGDYLKDGDELLGTVAGLDLPALGASPLRRDIFFEYDWFDDTLGSGSGSCGAAGSTHSHRPTAAIATRVSTAFASAPLANPDGTTGIVAHHDYGQGPAPFTGGNLVADADGVLTNGVNNAEFVAIKNANIASNRNGYFYYTLLPHYYNTNSTSSGQAELPGDDLIVSLYCSVSTTNVGNTIVHEVGHNLNLQHGGNTSCNYKPNYNSVMNYKYQFPGVDTDCNSTGNGVLDYSRGVRITLNENSLNENAGVCGSTAINWNGVNGFENPVSHDVNSSDTNQVSACGGTLTTYSDFNDWANITFTGLANADLRYDPPEIIDCDNPAPQPTPEELTAEREAAAP